MEAWREELYHHGILGQKWGARNGPPYPLGEGEHSAAEKRKNGGLLKRMRDRRLAKKRKKKRAQALEKARAARKANLEAKKRKEEHDANKQKVLQSGKASEVMKYKGEMTNQELQQVLSRLDMEQRLGQYSAKEVKSGMDKVEAVIGKVSKGIDIADKTLSSYNKAAKIINSVAGTKLPKLEEPKKLSWDEKNKQEINRKLKIQSEEAEYDFAQKKAAKDLEMKQKAREAEENYQRYLAWLEEESDNIRHGQSVVEALDLSQLVLG